MIRRGPGRPKLIITDKPGRPSKQYQTVNSVNSEYVSNPTTFKEAISRTDSNEWKKALSGKYDSLISNNTWELVDLPKGTKPVSCKWTYVIKKNKDSSVDKYKARLVAKGFSQ